MADFLKVSVTGNIDAALDRFTSEIQSKVARAGAQEMAQVVYEAAKQNAPETTDARYSKGGKNGGGHLILPGALKKAVYQVFSTDNSSDSLKTYHVGWNHKKAPHGYWVEFGNSKMPARPFLYPAYEQNKGRLVDAANSKMAQVLKEIK
jgi:HK97 gp10 family phage protein